MEFNINLTEEDYIEAGVLARKEFSKKGSQHTIFIISWILLTITFLTPAIFVIVVSMISGRNVVETIMFALALSIILLLFLTFSLRINAGIGKAYGMYALNKYSVIGTFRYTITTDTIIEETKYWIIEIRIQGINDYFENSKLYYITAPGGGCIFPKKQIEQIAEKDEFHQWINGIKKQTEKLSEGNLTGSRFRFLRKGISIAFREMFIEDSPRKDKGDTTMNNEDKH